MAKIKKRPLLLAVAGAAAVKVLACAPYPPGNLIVPPCDPDGGRNPCEQPDSGSNTDGGTGDGGTTDGGDGG